MNSYTDNETKELPNLFEMIKRADKVPGSIQRINRISSRMLQKRVETNKTLNPSTYLNESKNQYDPILDRGLVLWKGGLRNMNNLTVDNI